ncbi:hypothetical protein BU25DRAFT_378919 [Macroventuria anomochaeta]|uniref:Uncharacterized protein n=1 Tax=Macroventuria anomochaeta TaxID=301207 RepID=A0ACB6RJ45_9PLEO|nr:uncharacterized protein BU25DRAFT_378919 [Macroventuria anomochaeta]KAF2621763.1 hypothetical protein BU25DRAFT_378919 [Macroventuria anomochaeta]
MAGVSIRKSIRWLPQNAHEPTSTVVLSSAGRKFVDIRILNSLDKDAEDQPEILDSSRLDWAIAGTSSSIAVPDRGPDVRLSTFRHWIDSRTLDLASATDEGMMFPMETDGEDELVLEIGKMVNPKTGLLTDYEEVWIEKAAESVPSDDGCQIVVLEYDGPSSDRRGSIVRVGRLCQGLLRIKDQITAERWEWNEGKGWWRSKAIGNGSALPCQKVLESLPSDTVEHEGISWTLVECSQI